MKILIFNFFIILFLISCSKNSNPFNSQISYNFLFVERVISTKGELIEGDSSQIIIRAIEPGMFYSFDQQNRILEYTSGEYSKVPINDDLVVWIASQHYWMPPDQTGLEVNMFPIYYKATRYIDSTLTFGGLNDAGTVHLSLSFESRAFYLPIDSLVIKNYSTYKKYVQVNGDTALIKLNHKVYLKNHGYLTEDQVIWTNLTGELQ